MDRSPPNATLVQANRAPAAPVVVLVGSAWITTDPAVPGANAHGTVVVATPRPRSSEVTSSQTSRSASGTVASLECW